MKNSPHVMSLAKLVLAEVANKSNLRGAYFSSQPMKNAHRALGSYTRSVCMWLNNRERMGNPGNTVL